MRKLGKSPQAMVSLGFIFLYRHQTSPFDFQVYHPSNSRTYFPISVEGSPLPSLSSLVWVRCFDLPCICRMSIHAPPLSASPPSIGKSHPHPLSLTLSRPLVVSHTPSSLGVSFPGTGVRVCLAEGSLPHPLPHPRVCLHENEVCLARGPTILCIHHTSSFASHRIASRPTHVHTCTRTTSHVLASFPAGRRRGRTSACTHAGEKTETWRSHGPKPCP